MAKRRPWPDEERARELSERAERFLAETPDTDVERVAIWTCTQCGFRLIDQGYTETWCPDCMRLGRGRDVPCTKADFRLAKLGDATRPGLHPDDAVEPPVEDLPVQVVPPGSVVLSAKDAEDLRRLIRHSRNRTIDDDQTARWLLAKLAPQEDDGLIPDEEFFVTEEEAKRAHKLAPQEDDE
jgi:predicted RNA-binding Zn-ribbon protein involved in translation (DUF1610 family)